jgi:pimeloyl-ACP methyl ester carboxylesterase
MAARMRVESRVRISRFPFRRGLLPAAFVGTLLFGATGLEAQSTAAVAGNEPADPSPHRERFVAVNGARVQVLDWGGRGPTLLFMPGSGMGAHAFDEIAPDFRDRYHVLALTPRGFPPSSAPDSGYTITQLAADVAALLDSLGTRRAILAGHSLSGAVITRFAEHYPERLLAAVYLDGAFDFGDAYRYGQALPIRRPPPTVDTTAAHYRAWERKYDPPNPLLDRDYAMWTIDSTDRARRSALVSQLATEVRSQPHEFWRVRAPALSICALGTFDRMYGWLTPDSTRWVLAQNVARAGIGRQRRLCEEFRRRVPRGESLLLESGHLVFVDRRADVTRAMRRFLGRVLPPPN